MSSPLQQHANKVMTLMNAGNFAQAVKVAKAGMKKFPNEVNFANVAGTALAQMGQTREAIPYFAKALKQRPGDIGLQDNLIQAMILSGEHDKARALIEKLAPKRANPAQLFHLKASSYMQVKDPEATIAAATQAITADPKHATSYNLRGIAYTALHRDEAAMADLEKAHELTPNDPDPLANMGLPLSRLNRHEEAMERLEQALQLRPTHMNSLHGYAIQLAQVGRIEEAADVYKRLLELDPLHGEAYSELVQTQKREANLALEPALRAALSKAPRKHGSLGHMTLALGNILFQKGDFGESGKVLARANALIAETRQYDTAAAEAEFAAICDMFPVGHTPPPSGDEALPRPIFIIGQPRSGTTLTEMILSAHPDARSCGELPQGMDLSKAVLKGEADWSPAAFAEQFRAKLPKLDGTPAVFVDKLPVNYRYVGFLKSAFPRASVIHLTRDPRDVALSMWRRAFPDPDMNYTFDLSAMARNANLYKRYIAHWDAVYGDDILTLDYRDVVSDVQGASRRMAAHCGLDWVPEMAAPEKNTARVQTASVVQVREGVHQKSLGGWQALENHLGEFTNGLDPQLWPELGL